MCGRVFFALKIAIRKAYDSELKSRGAPGGKLSRNRSKKLLHKKISRVFFVLASGWEKDKPKSCLPRELRDKDYASRVSIAD